MNELNICLIQSDIHWEDKTANLHHFESIIRHIHNADLIILPEMFTTGFSMNAEALWEDPEAETLQWMRQMSQISGAAITGSWIVKDMGKFFNRLYFVKPDGDYQCYDKRHLFTLAGEEKVYTAGTEKLVLEYKGWRIVPFICYDLRFPVWIRNVEEADLIIFVASWPERRAKAWSSLLKARAIENMCYVAGLSRIGVDDDGINHIGASVVLNEFGDEVLELTNAVQDVQSITLQKDRMLRSREKFSFLSDRDRFQIQPD